MVREVLSEGESHRFLEAKSKKVVRKAPPIRRKEKPLVDLPVGEKVPDPKRVQHDGIWHKPSKPMLIESKIEMARNSIETNPRWLRQCAAREAAKPVRHSSLWLDESRRNVPPPERPMSSSYKPRYRSDRFNFSTGAAKGATQQLEETKMLYYAPLSGSSHTSAMEFRASLRSYTYLDERLFKKMKEKQMENKWKKEAAALKEIANAESSMEDENPLRALLEKSQSRRFNSGEVMEPPALKRTLTFRSGKGRPGPIPVTEHAAMQNLHPEGLKRIASRSKLSSVTMNKQDMSDVIHGNAPRIDLVTAVSGIERDSTPQVVKRKPADSGRGQQQIILGIANSEIRDKYHIGGKDEVDKLLEKTFKTGDGEDSPDASSVKSPENLAEMAPVPVAATKPSNLQPKPAKPQSKPQSPEKVVKEERGEMCVDEAAPDEQEPDAAQAEGECQPETGGEQAELQGDKAGQEDDRPAYPPCSKDSSIFKRLAYNTILKQEIPDTKPAWLSYCVHEYTPPEPYLDPLLRIARLRAESNRITGTHSRAGAGKGGSGPDGKRRPVWKKGARPIRRDIELPSELMRPADDQEEDDGPEFRALTSRDQGRQATWSPRSKSPRQDRAGDDGHSNYGGESVEGSEPDEPQRWKPKHFSNDIYTYNLRIRQAEQLLTPLNYHQQQARGHS